MQVTATMTLFDARAGFFTGGLDILSSDSEGQLTTEVCCAETPFYDLNRYRTRSYDCPELAFVHVAF
jgi:hypothetical protein